MTDHVKQFCVALSARGILPPQEVRADGKLHRCDADGKNGKNDAAYLLHLDGIPAGGFENHRDGMGWENWRADIGRALTSAEEGAHRARADATTKQREAEESRKHAEARDQASQILAIAKPGEHLYRDKKHIKAHGTLVIETHLARTIAPKLSAELTGLLLVIPMRLDSELHSLQFIAADATKRPLTGGRSAGCYFSIGTPKGAKVLCICEGFATGATIHEATGYPVAVAFSAGNLMSVAKLMRRKFPTIAIVLCADNDAGTTDNPGLRMATKAALGVGGMVAIPKFTLGELLDGKMPSDMNDLAVLHGLKVVKHIVDAATPPGVTTSVLGATSGVPDAWSDPLPIPTSLLPVDPFDFALLPETLRHWVYDIAERMQCPPDFPAIGAMVVLSSVIGRKACIRPKRQDDWSVIPNLWGAVVGRPGVMKSPALSEILKPLDRLTLLANDLHAEAMRDCAIKLKLAELGSKNAENKAKGLVSAGKISEAESILLNAAEEESVDPPPLRRYKVTDASVEALGEILIENPWGTLAYRDELNGLLRNLDKEGQEGARAFYLQGYDGNQGYTFDRIMRGKNLHIDAVCIAMLGGIQPGKLQSYIRDATNGGAGDDGLLQRFGMLVWPDIGGDWKNVDRWPDTPAKSLAFETIQRLDALQPGTDAETGKPAPAIYHFTPEAQDLFDTWRHEFETDLRSGERHPAMESHLSKYRKLVPALALVIALADHETTVSCNSLLMALAWAEYLQTHAMRAYAAGTRPATEGASALLAKIKSSDVVDGFSPRDVYLKGWAHISSPEAVHTATKMLDDLNCLRRCEHRPGASGGRPSITFRINPALIGVK